MTLLINRALLARDVHDSLKHVRALKNRVGLTLHVRASNYYSVNQQQSLVFMHRYSEGLMFCRCYISLLFSLYIIFNGLVPLGPPWRSFISECTEPIFTKFSQ